MPTTLQVARRGIGRLTNTFHLGATTTNITTSDAVIDVTLEGLGYHEDDDLNGAWVWLNTSNNANIERKIKDHAGATGTLTIRGANLTTETGSVAFEIHQFKPSAIRNALNQAADEEYKHIFQQVEDVTLTTQAKQTAYAVPTGILDIDAIYLESPIGYAFEDNILQDYGGFENWAVSTKPDGSNTPTGMTLRKVAETDDMPVKYGNHACKAVVTLNTAASHYWTDTTLGLTVADYGGQRLTYSEWVYCLVADRVKLEIADDQGSSSSAFHQGKGFERLVVSHDVTPSPTSLKAGITATSGAVIALSRDNAIWVRGFTQVSNAWERLYNWQVYNGLIRFPYTLPEDRALRLSGRKRFSTLSADTDTIELEEPQIQILYAAAIIELYRGLEQERAGKTGRAYEKEIARWGIALVEARRRYRLFPPQGSTPISMYWR